MKCRICKRDYKMQLLCLCVNGSGMNGMCIDCIKADPRFGPEQRRIEEEYRKAVEEGSIDRLIEGVLDIK